MRSSKLLFAVAPVLAGLLASCGSGGEPGKPPKNLHYSAPSAVYARGLPIAPNQPSFQGTVKSFSVEPPLPDGLALDPKTGVITGTPTEVTRVEVYRITAKNKAGKTSADVALAVDPQALFAVVGCSVDDTLSVYAIDSASGSLLSQGYVLPAGSGVDTRNLVAHPSGTHLYAVDGGNDRVLVYSVDPLTAVLTARAPAPTGSAPHAMVIDAGGCHAYVLASAAETLETFAIDPATGELAPAGTPLFLDGTPKALAFAPDQRALYVAQTAFARVQALAIDPGTHAASLAGPPEPTGPSPMAVVASPDGRFVYTADLLGASVTVLEIDPDTGGLARVDTVPVGTYPADLAIDSTGRFLYVANSGDGTVYSFRVLSPDGELVPVGVPLNAGERPVALELETIGQRLYALDLDGNAIKVYRVDPATGVLAKGREVRTREQPFAMALVAGSTPVAPRPRFAFAGDFGSRDVQPYSVDAESGALTSAGPSAFSHGSPQALVATRDGAFVIAATTLPDELRAFACAADGSLAAVGAPLAIGADPCAAALEPSGRFLYVAQRGADAVSAYSVASNSGALVSLGAFPTQSGPAALAIEPTGRFLYVANKTANTVSTFRINPQNGSLSPLGPPVPATGKPSALAAHPNGQSIDVALEQIDTAVTFAIDPWTGGLAVRSVEPTGMTPVAVAIEPYGRFAYVANRNAAGLGDVTHYAVDPSDGAFQLLGSALAGLQPSALVCGPDGRFLFVANEGDDQIWTYALDADSGAPTKVHAAGTGVAPRALALVSELQ